MTGINRQGGEQQKPGANVGQAQIGPLRHIGQKIKWGCSESPEAKESIYVQQPHSLLIVKGSRKARH
jgi:hypothetical protein